MMVTVGEGSMTTLAKFLRARAQEQMETLASELQGLGSLSIFTGVEGGDAAESIVKASSEFDLIVMGTHGRKGMAHLLVGSVAERVVRRSNCPVLTIRKRDVKLGACVSTTGSQPRFDSASPDCQRGSPQSRRA